MNRITRNLTVGILALFLLLSTASCALFQSAFEGKVVTSADNVAPGAVSVPADLDLIKSKDFDKVRESGKQPVIVNKEDVVDSTKAVPLDSVDGNTLGTILNVGLGIANQIWPGVAALEGIGLLLSQRKREHYVAAVKSLAPTDGTVDVKETILSVGKALGLAHSNGAAKEAWEKEVKAS